MKENALTRIGSSSAGRRRRRDRRGLTVIELLAVMAIIGILANIAFPVSVSYIRRASAVQGVTDFEAIRNGIFSYHAENGVYPASEAWGVIPEGLAPHLPSDFDFSYKSVDYRWRLWSLPDGTPSAPGITEIMGLQIQSSDAALMKAIQDQWAGRVIEISANKMTFVIL